MKMKKFLCLLLSLLMLLPLLVACKPDTPDTPDKPDNPDEPENPQDNPGKDDPGKEDQGKDKPEEPPVNESPNELNDDEIFEYYSMSVPTNDSNSDKPYIYRNMANSNANCRFADNSGSLIYHFDIRVKYEPMITMKLSNNYKIEVSPDGKTWKLIYDWLDEHETCMDRSNNADFTINPYDYEIYDHLYVRLTDSDTSNGWGACISDLMFAYYLKSDISDFNIFKLDKEDYKMIYELIDPVDASPVETYAIHRDGGLIYNPISREKAAELTKYQNAPSVTGTLTTTVDGAEVTVKYQIPKAATAYDALPIKYEVTSSKNISKRVYVDATAFEMSDKTDTSYYDLTLPGKVDIDWTYEGYVSGTNQLANRTVFSRDLTGDKIGTYPQYKTSDLTRSGTVPSSSVSNLMWLKFKYTNTGNTILDGDGNGTFCFEAILQKKQNGNWVEAAKLENLYTRIIDEVYPGESGEMYFTFNAVPAGEYRIVLNGLVRNETSNPENYGKNIWGGETYTSSTFAFTVSDKVSTTTPNAVVKGNVKKTATRNTWLHRYEEFMSSYDSLLSGIKANEKVSDVMYLQCAPWTDNVTLRLIVGDGETLSAVNIPIDIDTDSVKVTLNKDNQNYVVLADGTRFPAISAQSMADMRGNVQLGPDAASNILDNLVAMKNCGVNLINTTAAFEFDGNYGRGAANNIDACWFSLDAARLLGLKTEGWITYPYKSNGNLSQANDLYKLKLSVTGYGSEELAKANGLNALWQFLRWGVNYWIGGKDTVVLDVEDTRGWMRVDYNARDVMSESSKENFRLFLRDLYDNDIDELNTDWETDYASFRDIDPEAGVGDDHGWASYKSKNIVFAEWSRPLALLDAFRTLERGQDYQRVLAELKETIPTAKINLRTEGGNWIVPVDPETDNAHLRHVYYSQRRCGIIPELMAQSGTLYAHSDYTTLPYTPSEVAELTKNSVENGIIPMLLPQFDRMRDIAVNERYGTDFSYEYNISGAVKGAYINTTCSVFEWFRATYENGGVPGILWQDYLCDGYATSTQRKEIAFFTQKLQEAINTPEGQAWAKNFTQDSSVLSASKGLWSFNEEDVRTIIDNYLKQK